MMSAELEYLKPAVLINVYRRLFIILHEMHLRSFKNFISNVHYIRKQNKYTNNNNNRHHINHNNNIYNNSSQRHS